MLIESLTTSLPPRPPLLMSNAGLMLPLYQLPTKIRPGLGVKLDVKPTFALAVV